MTRGGRKSVQDEPERRCIVTRESRPRRGLIRFVIGPEDAVVPDLAERLPGRGIWVTADRRAVATAVSRNLFARVARRQVRVEPDLADVIEAGLVRRLVELIALARRAGEAVAGREKVVERLKAERAAVLIQAADGSPREKAALKPPGGPNTYVDCLTANELGVAFARDRVIHAALDGGGLAERVKGEALRLGGFRSDTARSDAGQDAAGDVSRDERLVRNG